MIAVIDYGMGNLRSVQKALESQGADARVLSKPEEIDKADKLVFPGVGAFKDAAEELERRNLVSLISEAIGAGKPFLGLCLGLQLLFEESDEGGIVKGLGIIEGRARRFDGALKVPHMGWNQIKFKIQDAPAVAGSRHRREKSKDGQGCPLFKGIDDGAYFYFVHSYYVVPKDESVIAAETHYGIKFASAIWKDNIYATQFHPEKSQEAGLKILRNFVEL